MSRTLPTECGHGYIFDWGDFGPDEDDGQVGTEKCPHGCFDTLKRYTLQEVADEFGVDLTDTERLVVGSRGVEAASCQLCLKPCRGYLFDGPDKVGHYCADHLVEAVGFWARHPS